MRTIKIFLASSAELSQDREEIREMISVENDRLHPKGVYLQLVQWEYFMDAVSDVRLQDEYNKAIADCDVVLSLFHTKAGKYTQEEFQYAFEQFKATGKPLIYTYFKTSLSTVVASGEHQKSLADFKAHLSQLGHFYTTFADINDLKYKLKLQLDRLLESYAGAVPTAPERGVMLYKIPPKMQLQVLHRCLIRVSYEKETILRDLPDYANDFTLREQVRMADSMEVILVENTAFEVIAINAERQAVEKGDYTEWNFDVRPLQLGRYPLTFRVSVVLPNGLKQVVLTEAVEVVTEQVADVLEMKAAVLSMETKKEGETYRGLEALPDVLGSDDSTFQPSDSSHIVPPLTPQLPVFPPPPPLEVDPPIEPPVVDPLVIILDPPIERLPKQVEPHPTPVSPAPQQNSRKSKRSPLSKFGIAASVVVLIVCAGLFLPQLINGPSTMVPHPQDSLSIDSLVPTDTLGLPPDSRLHPAKP